MTADSAFADVSPGQSVYDDQGNELGQIRGVDRDGFYVTTGHEDGMPLENARDVFGKAYVMWRCWDCGQMGRIDGEQLPEACPDCDSPREALYYWAED